MDNSCSDIGLCFNKKILESGTSNILFINNGVVYSPLMMFIKVLPIIFLSKN